MHIVVTFSLPDEVVRDIRALDPKLDVHVLDAAERYLFRNRQPIWRGYDTQPWPEGAEPGAEVEAALELSLARAEVMFTPPWLPPDLAEKCPDMRWVHLASAGADPVLNHPILSRATVTTSSGIHAGPIGEFVLGMMIMLAKGWPGLFRAQAERRWQRLTPGELRGKTVGIVGMGHIGSEVARLARALGMRVIGTRRSVAAPASGPESDKLLPPSQLHSLLGQSDFAVIATPYTQETHHLIGEPELAAMKPSAYLINIARGAIVDEPALVRALQDGRIAGAGLDVFEREPLPQESPLWGMENVIIAPHVSGATEDYAQRVTGFFRQNLRRYLRAEPLLNVVDPQRGY